MKKTKYYIFLLFISLLISACGGGVNSGNTDTELKSIVIFVPDGYKEPLVNETFQLKVEGIYSQTKSEDITAKVNWQSSNEAVATITPNGIMETLTNGEVAITANFSGFLDHATLIVSLPPTIKSIKINQLNNNYFVDEEKTLKLSALATLSGSEEVSNDHLFDWSSSNSEIATVDEKGNVTGIRYGNADITATAKENSAISNTISITVNPAAIGLSLARSTTYITIGSDSTDVIANQDFSDGSSKPAPTLVQWEHIPDDIAHISATGSLETIKLGTTTSTATYGIFQLTHEIVVESPLNLFIINDTNGFITLAWNAKKMQRLILCAGIKQKTALKVIQKMR